MAVCVAAFGRVPGAMGCNTGAKGTKGVASSQPKSGSGGRGTSSGKGWGASPTGSPKLQPFTKLEKQMERLVELFKTKMNNDKKEARVKVLWDCTLCQAMGNWASRDTCRSCKAPKQVEPLVVPPGLALCPAVTAAVKQPQQPEQAMEVDTKVEQGQVETDTKPILAAKIKERESLLKDMGEAEPGTKRATIVAELKDELTGLRGKLAQAQPVASQLAIATAAKEKAMLAAQVAAKAMEEAEAALIEARKRHQEAVAKEQEVQQHLEEVAARVPRSAQYSPQAAWAGVVQVLQQQGLHIEPFLKGLLAQALGFADPVAVQEGPPVLLPGGVPPGGNNLRVDPRQGTAALPLQGHMTKKDEENQEVTRTRSRSPKGQ